MLEIRKGTATKNYENTFFREFAQSLVQMFDKYSLNGLLIGNSVCEIEKRLQIDALLITKNVVCIIDFKNYGDKIKLPREEDFEFGKWMIDNGDFVKGGSSINPFIQLKNQKERFIDVVEKEILNGLPKSDYFNPYHTIRVVCFQKAIELIGSIPSKEELNFFIIDKSNYLEKLRDIIDITDNEVSLSENTFELFKEIFRADKYDLFEEYEKEVDYSKYETELDYDNLYPDQKLALSQIESFMKAKEERFFILQGTSLSGKTHLIPFIKDVAFNNSIPEVKLFASSHRVANNLLKDSNMDFNSIYSYIYGGSIKSGEIKEIDEIEKEEVLNLDIVPLKISDDTEEAIFIVDESHLVSDNYHQSIDLRFGSGKLLEDFIKFSDLSNSKRKIIFVGDSFQLSIGKKEESALNPDYLTEKYKYKTKVFQLSDKKSKSLIVEQALKVVNCIRGQYFNNLSFDISETLKRISPNEFLPNFEKLVNSNMTSPILCFSKSEAQKVNFWVKKHIIKNRSDLQPGDLVMFWNNIRVEDENDPFAEPKRIYNGQFGYVESVSNPITKREKLNSPLTFRKVSISLKDSNSKVEIMSFENFRLSEKGELSREEILSYKILLYQLAEKEIENFQNGKYNIDDELRELLRKLKEKERVKTKVIKKIQRILSNRPSTEYYQFKNSAQLRFGWALTVHKAMSYKWDEVFFNVETNGGKTNENYFRWIYTGMIRATQKVNLINYQPISPFCKLVIQSSSLKQSNDKKIFYVADPTIDLSLINKEIIMKHNFPENEKTSYLLQLYQFLTNKIEFRKLNVNTINHHSYQELYEIKGNEGELATISIFYNKKGHFKMPTLMKSHPKEFGDEVLEVLKSNNEVTDFEFINDDWRKAAYNQLCITLQSHEFVIGYIIQASYKDTLQITNEENSLVVDMHYDGDGFFSTISAFSYTDIGIWTEFQTIINELKG